MSNSYPIVAGNFSTFFRQATFASLMSTMTSKGGSLSYFNFAGGTCGNRITPHLINDDAYQLYRWLKTPNAGKTFMPEGIATLAPWFRHFELVNHTPGPQSLYYPEKMYVPGVAPIAMGALREGDYAFFHESRPEVARDLKYLSGDADNVVVYEDGFDNLDHFIKHFPTRTANCLLHVDLGTFPNTLEQVRALNAIHGLLQRMPHATVCITYPAPAGQIPYRLLEPLSMTGLKNAHNAVFFADYSGRAFDPIAMYINEEITPAVAEAADNIKNRYDAVGATQKIVNDMIQAYNKESSVLSDAQRKERVGVIADARDVAVKARETFNEEYAKFRQSTNLPFNPYPAEYHGAEYVDDGSYIPTLAYMAPNPEWDGVGCAVLNGPSDFDETMRNIGESLQFILTLPSGFLHKRVGHVHEPVGGMKEMEVSYKYEDFRRTTLDLNPSYKYLLPYQLDEYLYKDWKRHAEKLFKYVPLNSGPKNMDEVRLEYMEGEATMHSKSLMNVFDPISQLSATKANKMMQDKAHKKTMDALLRQYRTDNKEWVSAIATTSKPMEKELKKAGLGNIII